VFDIGAPLELVSPWPIARGAAFAVRNRLRPATQQLGQCGGAGRCRRREEAAKGAVGLGGV